jgi:hypothetical protein
MASASINKHIDDFRRRLEGQEHLVESCCDGGKQKCETEGVDLPHTYPFEIVTTQKPEQIEDIIYRSVHTGKMELKEEAINRPPYYRRGSIEVWDFIVDQRMGPFAANVTKYLCRYPYKGNPLVDLKKARAYLDKIIALVEVNENDCSW